MSEKFVMDIIWADCGAMRFLDSFLQFWQCKWFVIIFSVIWLKVELSFFFCSFSVLEVLEKEFVEKVSASVSALSFILVIWTLFLMRCLKGVGWFLPSILHTIFQTVFVLVEEFSWFTKFCQLVLLACLIVFLALTLSSFNELRLQVRGSFWNLQRAAFHWRIAILQSLLNQGVFDRVFRYSFVCYCN